MRHWEKVKAIINLSAQYLTQFEEEASVLNPARPVDALNQEK